MKCIKWFDGLYHIILHFRDELNPTSRLIASGNSKRSYSVLYCSILYRWLQSKFCTVPRCCAASFSFLCCFFSVFHPQKLKNSLPMTPNDDLTFLTPSQAVSPPFVRRSPFVRSFVRSAHSNILAEIRCRGCGVSLSATVNAALRSGAAAVLRCCVRLAAGHPPQTNHRERPTHHHHHHLPNSPTTTYLPTCRPTPTNLPSHLLRHSHRVRVRVRHSKPLLLLTYDGREDELREHPC